MTRALPPGLSDCLLWSEELGLGYHPRQPMNYEGSYWQNYRQMDATPMGAALTRARVEFVHKHFVGEVVDIGIGGGRFVEESGAFGYDINGEAVDWLREKGRYINPYGRKVGAVTCWDSLEHIPEPGALLAQVEGWLFVSMPIYESAANCLASKHYKPGEHVWYWTLPGLIGWCEARGFELVELNHMETELGRDGIVSFAFRRFDG